MLLKLNHVTKQYKDSKVINDISLEIEKGEFISIVGQSGSGKSKLLHLIGGLDKPTTGEILFNGINIDNYNDRDMSKYRRDTIGFIFQDFNLDGNQTVINNITLPMLFARPNIKAKERKELALNALTKVNLRNKANCKAGTLSGGQQQRVAIARAIASNPTILLADEPTGNLDSKNGESIMQLLEDLNSKGYTVIMVTHNIEQSYRANKIIKIKDGKIVNIQSNLEESGGLKNETN